MSVAISACFRGLDPRCTMSVNIRGALCRTIDEMYYVSQYTRCTMYISAFLRIWTRGVFDRLTSWTGWCSTWPSSASCFLEWTRASQPPSASQSSSCCCGWHSQRPPFWAVCPAPPFTGASFPLRTGNNVPSHLYPHSFRFPIGKPSFPTSSPPFPFPTGSPSHFYTHSFLFQAGKLSLRLYL